MSTVDLSQLPPPQVIDVPEFETLLTQRKARLVALYPVEQQAEITRTLALESEPIVKLLQENVYREILLRQRINEAALAVMVAYSSGSDLDQLAMNCRVNRLIITPEDLTATPPVAAVMESDDDLRLRIPEAFEAMSVAGPSGSYRAHARAADGRVADASAISPTPANVTITILSREGNGTATADLLTIVENALNDETVRPVADRLTVNSATIVNYSVNAKLYLYPGPEAAPILDEAKKRLQEYVTKQARLGRDIRLSAIYAALHVEGVQRVELTSPTADIVISDTQASYCTSSAVVIGGEDV